MELHQVVLDGRAADDERQTHAELPQALRQLRAGVLDPVTLRQADQGLDQLSSPCLNCTSNQRCHKHSCGISTGLADTHPSGNPLLAAALFHNRVQPSC